MKAADIKQLRVRELRKVMHEDPEMDGLLALDADAVPNNYEYNTYASRFIAGMRTRNIEVTEGQYADRESTMTFACNICGHTWSTMAKNAQQRGCPLCRKFQVNLRKAKKLWTRSKKIIRDKGGKIVKFPPTDPEKKPSVDEKFLLLCRKGHRFLSSHRLLGKDRWCPICPTEPGTRDVKSKESSQFVYKKRLTNPEKYARLRDIAEIKGSRVIDASYQTEAYTLLCTACGKESRATAKQVCDNRYLCVDRCIQGNRFTLHDR